MSESLLSTSPTKDLLTRISGLDQPGGDERVKRIVRRVVSDLFKTIEEFDVTPNEFWTAISYLAEVGQRGEWGLLEAAVGFEHFLDLRFDEKERQAGLEGGTPRTIEGPLYLADAPLSKGEARLDQDAEDGEVVIMHGQVRDTDGKPIAEAIVDVWHANTKGLYSFFDPSQSAYNLRRRIETDADGRYRFRTIMPAGYALPPDGPTQKLLNLLGRHGRRPAHIHFFVDAPGHRRLTTQINIAGDEYLYDDVAFATRDELIPRMTRNEDPAAARALGLDAPFTEIVFDFVLNRATDRVPDTIVLREHAKAA
ncbi:MAG TPA: catechol 1,2-dioxygenase [Acetobacteraceae bacterium]|jgi:catechol 1,2-dioxygenase|nr:catechol 1,2-dioxygenase [Acetobacteraceae bacterium]